MKLLRLFLVWFVGLLVTLGFSLSPGDPAMAGAPAAALGAIQVEIDEQGLLHLTPNVDSQGWLFPFNAMEQVDR